MVEMEGNRFRSEGGGTGPDCVEKVFGNSLERVVTPGEIYRFGDEDHPSYARKGSLNDRCKRWAFQPDKTEGTLWMVNPDPGEQVSVLAPFAVFPESLQVDVMNLTDDSL